jgi:phosphatidate cytidylyltransferase
VSPKKTWAGSWGGLACCTAGCLGLGLLWGLASWPAYLLLGLALGVAAQAGDFFESALKRHLDVKDSGRLLPGHGGVLDRIDSLLLVVPAYAAARALHVLF